MSAIPEIVKRLSELHGKIAADVWPHGARLVCTVCGYEREITTDECAFYLGHGWPDEHCDQAMRLESADIPNGG